jgi:hypothetical protein
MQANPRVDVYRESRGVNAYHAMKLLERQREDEQDIIIE